MMPEEKKDICKENKYALNEAFYNDFYEQIERLMTFGGFFSNNDRLTNFFDINKAMQKFKEVDKNSSHNENHSLKALSDILGDTSAFSGLMNFYNMDNKKTYFIEEFRCLILFNIKTAHENSSTYILKKMHMYLHLVQLSMQNDISDFEKLNTFLNTNFKIENKIERNLIRGNFGVVIESNSSLKVAIEEFQSNRQNKSFNVNNWSYKHKIPRSLHRIFSNNQKEFDSILEFCCYKLKFDRNFNVKEYIKQCDLLKMIFMGDLQPVFEDKEIPDSFKLACILIKPEFMEYNLDFARELFKKTFLEVLDINFYYASKFLIYSKHKNMLFTIYAHKIDFATNVYIDDVIDLAHKNNMSYQTFVHCYIKYLQDQKMHYTLFKTIIKYKICEVDFTKEDIRYVLMNYERINEVIANITNVKCRNLQFILYLNVLNGSKLDERLPEHIFEFLINHRYFYYAVDKITEVLCKTKNKKAMVLVLNRIVDADVNGISYEMYNKKEFMENFAT